MTLGGIIAVRNGDRLDYCWREAALSLLPICDEVILCDCDSDDGTRQAIDEWKDREPKITVANYPWTDPHGDIWWWPTFLNYARQHLRLRDGWCIQLDADEILHENSYTEVLTAAEQKKSLLCHRYNFWRDAHSLIPEGKCCGHEVIRVGPANLWMPSDYPDPRAEELASIAVPSTVQIMHYGFLRKRDAFFRKARSVQRIWSDAYDPRLAEAEAAGGNWMENPAVSEWINDLVPFTGTHPEIIKTWLTERGYAL